jgi:hypothetical protein
MSDTQPIDQNGVWPAFPCQALNSMGEPTHEHCPGLTKRELLAAMAMQGLLSNMSDLYRSGWKAYEVEQFACERADALLKELAK